MNFSWHLQGFSSLRSAPAERFTLLRFAGGVPALTLATKTVLPSLPACRAWMISLGMLGLFRMLGGMLIMPGPPGPGPMPIPPAAITFCMALLACSPSGSWDTHTHTQIPTQHGHCHGSNSHRKGVPFIPGYLLPRDSQPTASLSLSHNLFYFSQHPAPFIKSFLLRHLPASQRVYPSIIPTINLCCTCSKP